MIVIVIAGGARGIFDPGTAGLSLHYRLPHNEKTRFPEYGVVCMYIYKGTPGIHTKSGTPVKHQTRICTIWRVNGARRTPNNHKTSEGTSYVPWDNAAVFLWPSCHLVRPQGTATGDMLLALLVCHCHLKHQHHTHATYPHKVLLDKHGAPRFFAKSRSHVK